MMPDPTISLPQNVISVSPTPWGIRRLDRFPQKSEILEEARLAYQSLSSFRARRQRSRDYARGDATEPYYDADKGEWTTEDEFVRNQGRIPWKLRKIRPIIKNLQGQFRQNKTDRICFARNRAANDEADMMTEALRYVTDINMLDAIDADVIEESLVGGLYGWKVMYRWHNELNRPEVFVTAIDPTRIFYNQNLRDRRLTDLTLIGEVHDLEWEEVVQAFAETEQDEAALRLIYPQGGLPFGSEFSATGRLLVDSTNFYQPIDPRKCRVVEVWRKEYGWHRFVYDQASGDYMIADDDVNEELIANLNAQRVVDAKLAGLEEAPLLEIKTQYESIWRVYYLSPYGHVLGEQSSPYLHESHPYWIGFAGFHDGEVYGLVEDLIEPQRYVNRMVSHMDFLLGGGAKGLLMINEDLIPDGMTPDQFAEQYTRFNGVLFYKPKAGVRIEEAVKHITTASIPADWFSFLAMWDKQMKDISGVNEAVQGMQPQSGTPGILYQQQIMQAQLTTRNYFDCFFEARKMRDLKIVKTIKQFWEEPRYLRLRGVTPSGQRAIVYDPMKVRDIDFDIELGDVQDSIVGRQTFEADIKALLDSQRITFRQYLMASSHPKADYLLRLIEQTNPLLVDQNMNPEAMLAVREQLMAKARSGDKDATALLIQAA